MVRANRLPKWPLPAESSHYAHSSLITKLHLFIPAGHIFVLVHTHRLLLPYPAQLAWAVCWALSLAPSASKALHTPLALLSPPNNNNRQPPSPTRREREPARSLSSFLFLIDPSVFWGQTISATTTVITPGGTVRNTEPSQSITLYAHAPIAYSVTPLLLIG